MRSLSVTTAPSTPRSRSATCPGVQAVTAAVASTSKCSASRPTMSSNSGWETQTRGRRSTTVAGGDARRDLAHVAALRAMAQRLVDQHQGQHGLADRSGAYAHAGVVAAGGDDVDHVAVHVHALHRQAQAGSGLER